MSWNHRVIRRKSGLGHEPEFIYAVHEVYYNENGEIDGWTAQPVSPAGDDLKQLGSDLSRFSAALDLPVLEELESGENCKLIEVTPER
jgi:hypothetical protein